MTGDVIRVAILTVSDKAFRGERDDRGGPTIRDLLARAAFATEVADYQVVPDEQARIAEALFHLSEREDVDVVLTTGGTGLAPRDVTPEATRQVIEREAPGLAELIRADGLKHTPHAALSRAVAGTRKQTLIVNLPGSTKAVTEGIEALLPVLEHALDTLRGHSEHQA